MYRMESPIVGTRTGNLEVVARDGSITIVSGAVPLLHGTERDGQLCLRFAEGSGVRSTVEVVGALQADGFQLSGRGPVNIGHLTLQDATVNVTPSGVEISAPVVWADYATEAKFECGSKPGQWQGRIDVRESLVCLMTRSEVLRLSINMHFDVPAGLSRFQVLAVLEGRSIEVPFHHDAEMDPATIVSLLRRRTLAAVREYLLEELARSEAKFAAPITRDDLEPSIDLGSLGYGSVAVKTYGKRDSVPNTRSLATPGYLPAGRTADRPSEPASLSLHGYVDQRPVASRASAPVGGGYLAQPSTAPRATRMGGYLPREPVPVVPAGYLSSAWKARGLQSPTRRAEIRIEGTPSSDPTAEVNFERMAYAVLRCKSLLQAVEVAESREAAE